MTLRLRRRRREIISIRPALLICDMWAGEYNHLVRPMIEAAAAIRRCGIVIHAPWGVGGGAIEPIDVPEVLLERPPQPRLYENLRVYTRNGNSIPVLVGDWLTDDKKEIYTILLREHIDWVLVAGIAVNMCVLDRPYGIKQLVSWGFQVALVRNLTDIVHEESVVSHAVGLGRTLRYIETWWCETTEL